ncbi:zinc finger protein 557-like [Sitodiplosis mosellana]|uniref:zinc finger protein 557-like n=1 Tax=Sitodiplosis mosellana TaxID=263140 RepID=UPI00244500C9|nr:zinc finger protein 557-like [Sitodiplosis mosellana]
MSGIETVHQCLFCPQTFGSGAEKDDHVLDHFAHETCTDCNQNLIRIGANLYTLHTAVTCIKMELKSEAPIESSAIEQVTTNDESPPVYDRGSCNEDEPMQSVCTFPDLDSIEVERVEVKLELKTENEEPIECLNENISPECSDGSKQHIENKSMNSTRKKKISVKIQPPSNLQKRKKQSKRKKTVSGGTGAKIVKKKSQEKTNDNEESLECHICGKMLSCKYAMQRHKMVVHKTLGENCCNICIKLFSTAEDLAEHKANCMRKRRQSNTAVRFECDICGAILKNRAVLRMHMRFVHSPSCKQFKCTLCESSFVQQKLLDIHHNRKHLDIKEYVCSTCGKSFKTKDQLKSHTNSHTGERPFKCTVDGCEKGFKTRSNRESHIRTHAGGKRVQCEVEGCGRQFTFEIDLRRHKYRSHGIFIKKYSCSICSEIFPENSFLKKHMLKHHVQL